VFLSSELAEFLGAPQLPRTEVTKQVWAYIKERDLQNPSNRREILLDDALQRLFKRKKIDMFKMTKALSGVSS
jgi:SWIB-domain-containing proteins implicated in chromatin remodeling